MAEWTVVKGLRFGAKVGCGLLVWVCWGKWGRGSPGLLACELGGG